MENTEIYIYMYKHIYTHVMKLYTYIYTFIFPQCLSPKQNVETLTTLSLSTYTYTHTHTRFASLDAKQEFCAKLVKCWIKFYPKLDKLLNFSFFIFYTLALKRNTSISFPQKSSTPGSDLPSTYFWSAWSHPEFTSKTQNTENTHKLKLYYHLKQILTFLIIRKDCTKL